MRLWISLLPQTIHKTDETSDGPSPYTRLCVNNLTEDTLLIGDSEEGCVRNVRKKKLLALFQCLGFVIHPVKSVLTPSHKITNLGFEIDSEGMTVVAPVQKKWRKLSTASKLLAIRSSQLLES